MGNKVNKNTPVTKSVIVVNDALAMHGQAGYLVETAATDDAKVGVKMDSDNEVYEFEQSDLEELG